MYDVGRIKQEYLEKYESVNVNLQRYMNWLFSYTEQFEEKLGKDVCDFSISEIIELYKIYNSSSLEILMNMNSQLKRYAMYCNDIGRITDGINHFEEVDYDILKNCINTGILNKTIISADYLYHVVRTQISNASDKFLVLGLFEGIGSNGCRDYINLKMDDFTDNQVQLIGRTITVSNELYNYALESSNEYNYYSKNGIGKIKQYRLDDDRIIKDMINVIYTEDEEDKRLRRIKNKLSGLNDYFDSTMFNYAHVVESGRINMIKKGISETGLSAYDYINNHNKEIEERYGKIYAPKRYVFKYEQILYNK